MKIKIAKNRPQVDSDESGNGKSTDDRFEVDTFDRSTLIDRAADYCAMCKGDHAFGEELEKAFRMSTYIDDGGKATHFLEQAIDVNDRLKVSSYF